MINLNKPDISTSQNVRITKRGVNAIATSTTNKRNILRRALFSFPPVYDLRLVKLVVVDVVDIVDVVDVSIISEYIYLFPNADTSNIIKESYKLLNFVFNLVIIFFAFSFIFSCKLFFLILIQKKWNNLD